MVALDTGTFDTPETPSLPRLASPPSPAPREKTKPTTESRGSQPQPAEKTEPSAENPNIIEVKRRVRSLDQVSIPTPRQIRDTFDRDIVGNDAAKKTLATLVHLHQKRANLQVSVPMVTDILARRFMIARPDSANTRTFLGTFTRILQRRYLNRNKANPLFEDVRLLVKAGREQGLLRARPGKGLKHRQGTTQHAKEENEAAGIVRSLVEEWKRSRGQPLRIEKENVVIIGPTGSAKTEFGRCLARLLGVPFLPVDASQITQAGYHGDDAISIPQRLLTLADDDVELAGRSVVFLDELDKKARESVEGREKDVGGEGAQENLIRMTEDYIDHETGVDMSGVLFVMAGSFTGLDRIVKRRLGGGKIGFREAASEATLLTPQELTRRAEHCDLIEYGIVNELCGRISRIVFTDPVDLPMMKRIIQEPEHSYLRQRQTYLAQEGLQLNVTEDGIDVIAKAALAVGTGARALKTILSIVLEDTHFKAPELDAPMDPIITLNGDAVQKLLKYGVSN